MPDHQGDCRPLSFRQRQELSRQFTQGTAVGHDVIRDPKAVEDGKQRQRVFGSLPEGLGAFDQRPRPIKRRFGVRRPIALCVHLRVYEGDLKLDLLTAQYRRARQRRNLDERARKLRLGLDQSRARQRP